MPPPTLTDDDESDKEVGNEEGEVGVHYTKPRVTWDSQWTPRGVPGTFMGLQGLDWESPIETLWEFGGSPLGLPCYI